MQAYMKVALAALVGLAGAAPAAAQTSGTQAWEPVVFVSTVGGGGEIRARLVALDDATVTIRVDGQHISLPLADVRRIQKEGDGLLNGALIGGIGLGLWCALVCGQGMDDASGLPLAAVMTGVTGALIGTGIDALHKGRTTIYRPAPSAVPGTARLAFSMSLRF